MRFWQLLGPLGLAISVSGCAGAGRAVMGATAGVSMGAGVEHTLNGVAYKTFTAPLDNVRLAALRTLNQMDMPVKTDTKTDGGWEVSATAAGRSIDIELERLTERTTRMRVVANKGEIFFKDTSTATEIILQTAQLLQLGLLAGFFNGRH
jgi:Protein of unknown function (DUF3568)